MHAPWPRLVVATGNAGKLREFRALLAGLATEILPQTDLGVPSPEETESTFVGNALLKARHAARLTGAAALADDSGLEVDALGGAPGVRSARYAGEDTPWPERLDAMLSEIRGLPPERRRSSRPPCAAVHWRR